MLIDTHCHLEMEPYDQDRPEVVRRAMDGGIYRILTIGTNLEFSRKAADIADEYPAVFAAVGIHPHDAQGVDDQTYSQIRELAQRSKVIAYGEIGLDFYKMYSPKEDQRREFIRQLRVARELDLPLIIHDRDAHDETLEILEGEGGLFRGVFHCFAGNEQMADQLIALGFHISFTGSITFGDKMKAHRVIRACPADRLLIETDAPFLTPAPHRGKRNEPLGVRRVAEKIAEIKGLSFEDAAWITTDNAYRLFRFETFGRKPEIVYEHKQALYINLTSRCTNRCVFCAKHPAYLLGGHFLRLEQNEEPSVEQVLEAIPRPADFPEIVFCGFGEPTVRWNELLQVARELKNRGARRIRLNTNGLADLIQGRAVAGEMKGAIDAVSVSLNAPDAATYAKLCQPAFGDPAFPAILEFIKQAKLFVPEVVASAMEGSGIEMGRVKHLVENELGVPLRIR